VDLHFDRCKRRKELTGPVVGQVGAMCAGIAAGADVFNHPTFLPPECTTQERWGDYSAVTRILKCAFRAVNEKEATRGLLWGSLIIRFGFEADNPWPRLGI